MTARSDSVAPMFHSAILPGLITPASIFSTMTETTRALVIAGAIIAVALIVGLIIERILVGSIRRIASSTEGKIDDVIAGAIRGVARWGFLLIGIYYALPLIPLPDSIDRQITIGFRVGVLVLAIIVMARFASGIAAHYAHRLLPSSVSLATVVVNAVVMIIGLLVIFQTMGIQIAPMLAALGVGGLAVALALKDTLENFFAGIQILASKQIRPGDYVRLDPGNHEGVIYDVGWRTTTLRVPSNHYIIVPNTKMAQAVVSNYSVSEKQLGMSLTVTVMYGNDLENVERVALEAAREVIARVPAAIQSVEPVIRFHTFADTGIRFDVVVRVQEFTDQGLLKHELMKAVRERFIAEGITMPQPAAPPPVERPAR
jgi:small-conductance mechanosensitive channel